MTEIQEYDIEILLNDWYCEIYDECDNLSVARGSSEIVKKIKEILDT